MRGSPLPRRHKTERDRLASQVKEVVAQYEAGALSLPGALSKFLADWLTRHIKEEDMEMISRMRAKSG